MGARAEIGSATAPEREVTSPVSPADMIDLTIRREERGFVLEASWVLPPSTMGEADVYTVTVTDAEGRALQLQ